MVKEHKLGNGDMWLKEFFTFNKDRITKESTLVSLSDESDFEQVHHKKLVFLTMKNIFKYVHFENFCMSKIKIFKNVPIYRLFFILLWK